MQYQAVSTQVMSDSRQNTWLGVLVVKTLYIEDGVVDPGVSVRFPAVPEFAAENSNASRR